MSTQNQDRVRVDLIGMIDSITKAGKMFLGSRDSDTHLIVVRDRDLASVYIKAADAAKDLFDQGLHPSLSNFSGNIFKLGYDALKSGQIKVVYVPHAPD